MQLGDVLRADASLLGVKLVMDFGPQSRLFNSDLLYQGSADFELNGVTINLASVTFGNDQITLSIAEGVVFSYTRATLSADFVDDVVALLGPGAQGSAEILEVVLDASMQLFDLIPATLETSSLEFGGPRGTFTASFYAVESGIAVSTSGEDSVTLLIDDTTSKEYVYFQRENPDDYPPASELQGFVEDNPEMGIGVILEEVFGYQPDGQGIVYVLSDFQEQAQDALNNSFDFGSGDDGIVDGTDSADVIDNSYTDSDGTSISEGVSVVRVFGSRGRVI